MNKKNSQLRILLLLLAGALLVACKDSIWNNPYPGSQDGQSILYTFFAERPKHLDPAVAYSANEYTLLGQIYEPPFQYHYLKRPYTLVPLTATAMPVIEYYDDQGNKLPEGATNVAYTDYIIEIQPGIQFQPHPALAKDAAGQFLYHNLTKQQLADISTLSDFPETGTRELIADDYIYQIKRLASPKIHSSIAELMKQHIVGLDEFSLALAKEGDADLKKTPISGTQVIDRYHYRIRINGKYAQFIYWLAMPFFAPMPWEAEEFYAQQGLIDRNITLDWFPIGTGPYMLKENNPNRRMVMVRNPEFHLETYPHEGEPGDEEKGLLKDAGKKLPFIDKVFYILEKETIPYWNKFLQGYYDASAVETDNFDQAIQFTGSGNIELTKEMKQKGIQLHTAVTSSIYYMGFNMRDPVVGGPSARARKLRQAISIAIDYEEFISIFMNGQGLPAQGLIAPGIYGYAEGVAGINPLVYQWVNGKAKRKSLDSAKRLMAQAGYPDGVDPATGQALILYLDTGASGPNERARLNWYRKQFSKLGIQLVIRVTDYNRFQQKMLAGNAQIFMWGWNADYPDPENFFFLLYGPNAKVNHSGENAANYHNKEYDRLFEKMRNLENGTERLKLINRLQKIVRYDAPWVFGLHPKSFGLYHSWYKNLKPNLMANNRLKYTRLDIAERAEKRKQWNKPVFWPIIIAGVLLIMLFLPALKAYRQRSKKTLQ